MAGSDAEAGACVRAERVFAERTLKSIDSDSDVEPLLQAIRDCPDMDELHLQGFSFGTTAADRVANLLAERGVNMKLAYWSDIFVSRTKEEVPVALSSLMMGLIKSGATLTLLDLSNNAFGAQGVQSLVLYLEGNYSVNLQDLNLTNTGLGIGGAEVLSSALANANLNLKTLRIGRNRLENEGSIALAKVLKKFTTLEVLEMPQNGIYYPGIEALSGVLAVNKNMRELVLSDNTVGPIGSKALKEVLPSLTKLERLYLDDCLLKNQGAKCILEALVSPNLELLTDLNIGSNDINDLLSENSIENALFWRNNIYISLADNEFSKPFRDHISMGIGSNENSDIWFGDEEDLQDYYEDDEDEDDDLSQFDNDMSQHSSDEEEEVEEEETNYGLFIPTTVNDTVTTKQPDDVSLFLSNTCKENFCKLGAKPIDALLQHLNTIKDEDEYTDEIVQMIFKMNLVDQDPKDLIINMKTWEEQNQHRASILANAFLVHLGLMKSETKNKELCGNTGSCVKSFANALKSSEFSPQLREMILFVIKDKCSKEKKIGNINHAEFLELFTD